MLILGNSAYAGIPKTGSSWTSKILRKLGATSYLGPHTTPERGIYISVCSARWRGTLDGKQCWTFVRHPAMWYRSAWSYFFRDDHNVSHVPALHGFNSCVSDTYEGFLHRIIERCPGELSRVYESYCGPKHTPIHVARIEDAHYQLASILSRLAGQDQEVVNRLVSETPPVNASSRVPPLNVELSNRVCELDAEAMERYNYQPVRPDGSIDVGGRVFR